jgi:hypothetical protein
VVEGNTGRRDAVFTVACSRPLGQDTTVCLVPIGITALASWILTCGCRAAPWRRARPASTWASPSGATVNGSGTETFAAVALATGGVRHDDPLATATIVNDD